MALAGLGDLPDTILTRSVIVRMRRRAPNEHVEPYRRRLEVTAGHKLRDQLAAWADSVRTTVTDTWPKMPVGIEDRDADVWEALLAVADAAGGHWPETARVSAVSLVSDAKASTPSLGIRLLADLRTIFGDRDAMSTEAILSALQGLDEAPWNELAGGKPLNARGLAHRLGEYGVKSKTVRIGNSTPRGYTREDLADAWARYLPSPPEESATSATDATDGQCAGENAHDFKDSGENACCAPPDAESAISATTDPEVQHRHASATDIARHNGHVADVADVADRAGDGGGHAHIMDSPNGATAAHSGQRCVHCGVSVTFPGQLYCPRHGGRLADGTRAGEAIADDDPELADMVLRILDLTPGELTAYRAELAAAPPDDPDFDRELVALRRAEAVLNGKEAAD